MKPTLKCSKCKERYPREIMVGGNLCPDCNRKKSREYCKQRRASDPQWRAKKIAYAKAYRERKKQGGEAYQQVSN